MLKKQLASGPAAKSPEAKSSEEKKSVVKSAAANSPGANVPKGKAPGAAAPKEGSKTGKPEEKGEVKSTKEITRKQNKKRRMVGWVLLLIFGVLTLVGFLLAFMLTLQKEEEPSVDVNYSVTVATDITAKYEIFGKKEVEVGTISFEPNQNEYLSQHLSFGDIELTTESPSVKFTYSFINKDSVNCLLILQDKAYKNNITYSFEIEIDGEKLEDFSLTEGIMFAPGQVCNITQKVSIVNSNLTASYVSGENGALVWFLREVTDSEA